MRLDCANAQHELLSHFVVRIPERDKAKHLDLTITELVEAGPAEPTGAAC